MKTLELEKMEELNYFEAQELSGGYGAGNGISNEQQGAFFGSFVEGFAAGWNAAKDGWDRAVKAFS
jgi:hypothetical protein